MARPHMTSFKNWVMSVVPRKLNKISCHANFFTNFRQIWILKHEYILKIVPIEPPRISLLYNTIYFTKDKSGIAKVLETILITSDIIWALSTENGRNRSMIF